MRAGPGDYYDVAFSAMGCRCRIVFHATSRSRADVFRDASLGWVERFERDCSRFVPDSFVGLVNSGAGEQAVKIDGEVEGLLKLCEWYRWLTDGVFDPSMLPVNLLWDHRAEPTEAPSAASVEKARALMGWDRIVREDGKVFLPEQGMGIDLGGIGKEYAVDRVIDMSEDSGIQNILVDFGQDIRVRGQPPQGGEWRIGLEHFSQPGKCWTGIGLAEGSVASSGDYVRHAVIDGVRYGHILDPRTGYPVSNGVRQVHVIAPTCTQAGILSTAAFILGRKEGLDLLRRCHPSEGCIVCEDERVETAGFGKYVLEPGRERRDDTSA